MSTINHCENCKQGVASFGNLEMCRLCRQRVCNEGCGRSFAFCGGFICLSCLSRYSSAGHLGGDRCPLCETGSAEQGMHDAAKSGDTVVIQELAQTGISVNVQERMCFVQVGDANQIHKGRTPLYYAITGGHKNAVDLLLRLGARETAIVSDYPDSHPDLFEVAHRNSEPEIEESLGISWKARQAVEYQLTESDVVFLVKHGYTNDAIRIVQDYGVNLESVDLYGFTLLDHSIFNGNVDMLRFILPRIEIPNEHRAVTTALLNGQHDMVRLFLQNGWVSELASPDEQAPPLFYVLTTAVEMNDLDTVQLLLRYGADINGVVRNPFIRTPLLSALSDYSRSDTSNYPMALALLELGADINFRDVFGRTALHTAAQLKMVPAVQFLVENGADVNALDSEGRTPLHAVAELSFFEDYDSVIAYLEDEEYNSQDVLEALDASAECDAIINYLVQGGGDMDVEDKDRNTPLQVGLFVSGNIQAAVSFMVAGARIRSITIEQHERLCVLGLSLDTPRAVQQQREDSYLLPWILDHWDVDEGLDEED